MVSDDPRTENLLKIFFLVVVPSLWIFKNLSLHTFHDFSGDDFFIQFDFLMFNLNDVFHKR